MASLEIALSNSHLLSDAQSNDLVVRNLVGNAVLFGAGNAQSSVLRVTKSNVSVATELAVLDSNNVKTFVVDAAGNATLSGRLHLYRNIGDSNDASVLSTPFFWIKNSDTGQLYYLASNVGFGVANPTERVDVDGFVRASRGFKVESNDGSGVLLARATEADAYGIAGVSPGDAVLRVSSSNFFVGLSSNPVIQISTESLDLETNLLVMGNLGASAKHRLRASLENCNLAFDVYGGVSDSVASNALVVSSQGRVGVGTSLMTAALTVVGDVFVSGNVSGLSDARLKSDIRRIEDPLDKIAAIGGYTYYMGSDGTDRRMGCLAHEVEAVLPEAVTQHGEYKAVAYGNMMGLVVEAIKALDQQCKTLDAEIRSLESNMLQI